MQFATAERISQLHRRATIYFVTSRAKKVSVKHKVSLQKASASEILAALKVGRAEERRAKSAVASAKRSSHRMSGSVKRLSGSTSKDAQKRVAAK